MHPSKPGIKFFSIVSLLFIILFSACGPGKSKKPAPSGYSDDAFTERLKAVLKPIDTTIKKKIVSITANVAYVYQTDEYQPVWVKENYVPTRAADSLVAELEDMQWDGINPERYNLAAIKKLKSILDTTKHNSVDQAIAFDTALTHSYLAASHDLLMGRITPGSVDSLWYHVNDTTWNAPQLLIDAKGYTSLDAFRSKVPTYALLRSEYKRYTELAADSLFLKALAKVGTTTLQKQYDDGTLNNINTVIKDELPWLETVQNDTMSEEKQLVTTYQSYNGLQVTGKIDSSTLSRLGMQPAAYLAKISANMERVRWMQQQFGDLYLVVDVPLAELFLRKDGGNAMHMRVVVGKPERQTPSLFATMANVVINPPWGVPPTILKNDVVPGFKKDGRKYLAKKGLKPYDRNGKAVSVASLNMGNIKRYTYKQDPGDDNSLGVVKFNLPNPWDIYLHDTPHRDDFVKRYRALSSGCIRLQHPQEMALYILSEIEHKKYFTQGKLDTIIDTHKTRWEVLKTKIPVHIAYLTAFEDTTGKHLQFTRDIYGRDVKLIAAMQ
jgi:murein L,D-transpeptidase YcbB/YkuD